jgi:hypothetical protein
MGFSLTSIKQSEISESFKNISPETPCWIFASKNVASDNTILNLESKLTQFSDEWANHGKSLELCVTAIDHQVFVLFTLQEVSGCSKDSLLNHVQSLQADINVEWIASGSFGLEIEKQFTWAKVPEIKSLNAQKKINPDTLVCQLHLHQIGQVQEGQLFASASKTQLKRMIK